MSSRKGGSKGRSSVKSVKSTMDQEQSGVEGIEFDNLKEVILKEAEEGLGDTIVDTPLPTNIDEDGVFEATIQAHEEERRKLRETQEKLNRRQQALDTRKQLADERWKLEVLAWKQKLQLQEMEIAERQMCLELMEIEQELQKRDREVARRTAILKERRKDSDFTKLVPQTGDALFDTASAPGGMGAEGNGGARPKKMKPKGKCDANISDQADRMGTMTASQRKIHELEDEIKRLKAKDGRVAPKTSKDTVKQLQDMGLMPMNIPMNSLSLPGQTPRAPTREELKKAGLQEDQGKPGFLQLNQHCSNCSIGDKVNIKSGKYAKNNISIKVQEQWPHMNVLRKYCKRTVFDQLEFDAFVAGETRIIASMTDGAQARGRLEFLSRVAHWLCRCKDWNVVRGLYEAVLESIELGEEDWLSNFSHYENVLPNTIRVETKEKEKVDFKRREKEKPEIYWCKNFQKNSCTESSPHMSSIRPDEPPVPVLHLCAFCLQRDNRRAEHSESECPSKK